MLPLASDWLPDLPLPPVFPLPPLESTSTKHPRHLRTINHQSSSTETSDIHTTNQFTRNTIRQIKTPAAQVHIY